MYQLFIALVLLNVRFFAETFPVNETSSVYNTIKTHTGKCTYLQTTVLKTEPEFLKPCTNFSKITSIVSLSDENIKDVRCTIYYNYLVLLCATVNLTQEEIDSYLDKKKMEANLKNNTIVNMCKMFQKDDRTMETVEESMKAILPVLQSDQTCDNICSDFTGHLYPACNEAAYMIQVMILHNLSAPNGNKSSVAPANTASAPQTNATTPAKQLGASLQTKPEQQLPATQHEQVQQNKAQIQNSSNASKSNKPGSETAPEQQRQQEQQQQQQQQPPTTLKNDTHYKTNETAMKPEGTREITAAIPPPEAKTPNNTKLPESNEVQTGAGGQPNKQNDIKTGIKENKQPESEKNKVTPEKSETLAPGKNEPEKSSPAISEKEETINVPPESNEDTFTDVGGEDEGARRDDYQDIEEEPKQPEEIKQTEIAKPPTEANKQPEGKHKTPKPEETVDEELLSASNNQLMDEDDSYFFSYFMMICVVFILAYVAYHNKQKVFALVLEGRRGRRPSRSRRPNSANYHKLDSNLEEAVSSSCNKNTTHIIY